MSADEAYVVVEKAILYSDMEQTIPIGYIRKGKKLKVGKVARKQGTILPTVVSGRVVYVKRADIRLGEELANDNGTYLAPKVSDHEILFEEQKFEDDFSENNHLIVSMGNMAGGDDWNALSQNEQTSDVSIIGVAIEHRPELRKYSWAVGLNYLSAEIDNFTFKSITLEGRFQYSMIRFDLMAIDAVLGLSASGDVRLENAQTDQSVRGTLFGYSAGIQAKLFPFSQFGVIGAAEMNRYKVASLGKFNLEDGTESEFGGFSGAKIWVGVTYKL